MLVFAKSLALVLIAVIVFMLLLGTITAVVPTRFDRAKVGERWGNTVEEFFYGVCDPSYRAFLLRRKARIDDGAPLSKRFILLGPNQPSPVLQIEEAELLLLIDRSFGWKPAEDVEFLVDIRSTGYTKFYPRTIGMDGIELDECGWLIGDDFAERQRQAEHLRQHQQVRP